MKEQFTAYAYCEQCKSVDLHWLAEPRHKQYYMDDGTPLGLARNRIAAMCDMNSMISSGRSFYDPPWATVARVCRQCDHRWPQQ